MSTFLVKYKLCLSLLSSQYNLYTVAATTSTTNCANFIKFSIWRTTTLQNNKNYSSKSSKSPVLFNFHKYKPIMSVPEGLFKGVTDRFNGVTINSIEESEQNVNFAQKLKKSLDFWIEKKYRGIWFKVHTADSEWVPHLTKNGFNFHHAKKEYVMMFRWLPTTESENIPVYAHTLLGVGGLVVNDKNEVLVVSEKYSLVPNSWKLPGGYVEPKENLINAAIREVREETGIETKFVSVISCRHSHGGGFNCSDMYIVIGLEPLTQNIIRCEREISDVKWMPIDEYLNNPKVHEANAHLVKTFLDYKQNGIKIDCEHKTHQILKKDYNIYYVKMDKKQET